MLVNWLMRRFWFVWFFLNFQLYLHKLPYFEMHTDHVNSTLTLSTRVYTMSILLFLFFLFFTVLYTAPPHSCQTPVILAESSGIQWSPAEWNWIPVNSTGLQTEIEIELESGSKYMGTNSCKHKYSIYTDFCSVSVMTCNLSVSLTLIGDAPSFFRPIFPWYNNCGPISQLSKHVEVMLLDVVFIEKNGKDKNIAVRKIS